MKRFFFLILATLLLCTAATPALAAGSLVQSQGSITAVDSTTGQITVTLTDGSTLVFNTDTATMLLSAKDGSTLSLGDLKAGMSFQAFYSAATTRSLPPQSYLHTMIAATSSEQDFANDFNVSSVTVQDGNTDLLNTAGDLILHLSDKTDIRILAESGHAKASAGDIKAGAQLIAWYDVVAMSYPGQANPSKVLILSAGSGSGGGSDSIQPPKTGSPVNDTLAICTIVLSMAAMAAWILRTRRER